MNLQLQKQEVILCWFFLEKSKLIILKFEGAMISAVFAMQGFGILSACIVTLIFLSIFKNLILENVNNLDTVW